MEPLAAGQTGDVVDVEGAVSVIAGAGDVVKVLPDCVTVVAGPLCRTGVSVQESLTVFRILSEKGLTSMCWTCVWSIDLHQVLHLLPQPERE